MESVETLIIGAGISGLTYASETKEDYLIVEAESRPGGLCKSFYQDDFIWDYAGHFFHFSNPIIKNMFVQEIDPNEIVECKKKTNIYYHGIEVSYPFQMNIHQLPKEEFIDCLFDLFNRKNEDNYSSFQDMLYGKFGQSITEKFLKPYNEKLYACNLKDLDQSAMGRFFPYANIDDIIKNMKGNQYKAYNNTFQYPKSGAQYYVDILLKNIDKNKILLNSRIKKIDINNKIAIVNGKEIGFTKLISTIPLNYFIRIISDKQYANLYTDVLSCNKVLVFNLGFDKPAVDENIHWTYFPDKDINFYRVGFYNNILSSKKLSLYVEIGFGEKDIIDLDTQLQDTLLNLKKVGIITNHKLVAHNSLIINPGYVHITSGSIEKVNQLQNEFSKKNIFLTGRYGKWTYCSIEDCIYDAMVLAKN